MHTRALLTGLLLSGLLCGPVPCWCEGGVPTATQTQLKAMDPAERSQAMVNLLDDNSFEAGLPLVIDRLENDPADSVRQMAVSLLQLAQMRSLTPKRKQLLGAALKSLAERSTINPWTRGLAYDAMLPRGGEDSNLVPRREGIKQLFAAAAACEGDQRDYLLGEAVGGQSDHPETARQLLTLLQATPDDPTLLRLAQALSSESLAVRSFLLPRMRSGLTGTDRDQKLAALSYFASRKTGSVVLPELEAALADSDEEVRLTAVTTFLAAGGERERTRSVVHAALKSAKPETRLSAMALAVEGDNPADGLTPDMKLALADPVTRERAMASLIAVDALPQSYLPQVQKAIASSDSAEMSTLIGRLEAWRYGSECRAALLSRLGRVKDTTDRYLTCDAYLKYGSHPRVLAALRQLSRSNEPFLQSQAVRLLASSPDVSNAELLKLGRGPGGEQAYESILARSIPWRDQLAYLEYQFKHGNQDYLTMFASQLEARKAMPGCRALLEKAFALAKKPEARLQIACILGRCYGDPRGFTTVMTMLDDPEQRDSAAMNATMLKGNLTTPQRLALAKKLRSVGGEINGYQRSYLASSVYELDPDPAAPAALFLNGYDFDTLTMMGNGLGPEQLAGYLRPEQVAGLGEALDRALDDKSSGSLGRLQFLCDLTVLAGSKTASLVPTVERVAASPDPDVRAVGQDTLNKLRPAPVAPVQRSNP